MYDGNAATVIGKRVGNYVVERSLAQGNMGSVFVARHPALGREAAVKFLGRDLDAPPEMTKRFLDEARITASLRHPNIVDIFDFGELDGRLYYVMELLDGLDLAALIRTRQRFACGEVVDFLRQVCSGLAAAHAAGVVHRDLKPGNVFVVRETPARLKLMDFGVAKILSATAEQTHHGQIIGTPRYMSPEQALGQIERISPQSDIYSLGVIAYEMLAGRSPFEHQSPVMLLVMHVHHPVYPLEALASDAPAWLVELIEACLAKEPNDRPTSAQEILARISQFYSPASGVAEHSCLTLPSNESGSDQQSVTRIPVTSQTGIETRHVRTDPPVASLPSQRVAPSETVQCSRPELLDTKAAASSGPVSAPLAEPAVALASQHPSGSLVTLTETDRSVLNRLLFRMQRRGDFPAFVRNVGEVSKRADFESSFSAEQLGTAILKDYALTAKLLRIVNSAYANRFGGRIYSVRHAIVILGFDRVRSLALSTSVFKSRGNEKHSERISESAINALVSGEIARQVSGDAGLDDPEQATVCSMFRNLGRHLVLVYLPELYDQILTLVQQQGIGMNQASERVLGLSMHKLGVGIAERWRLPGKLIGAMRVIPERTGRLARDEDKLAALAEFSNKLCELIAGELRGEEQSTAMRTLLNRHKNLVQLDEDNLTNLIQDVQRSFEQRYTSLLGTAIKDCRFARAVATLTEQQDTGQRAVGTPQPARGIRKLESVAAAAPRARSASTASSSPRASTHKPRIVPLQLAKYLEPEQQLASPPSPAQPAALHDLLVQALDAQGSTNHDQLLIRVLRALAQELNVGRLLLLRATQNRRELAAVAGHGDHIEEIMKELRLPLLPARTASDPFSICFHAQRDFLIDDVFAPRVVRTLPERYFEVIGSSSLALLWCGVPSSPTLILMIDTDPPRQLPSAERFAALGRVRTALAKLAPLAAV